MPRRWLLVAGTFLLSVLLYVDRACISSAKEPITKALGLTDAQFGWALSAFALGYALLQTPSGALADRLGPRKLLSGVVALWSLFTGLTGAVSGFLPLVVVRFLFGAGEAGAFPGMARAAVAWVPLAERGRVQGINFSGSRLGAAFAMPTIATLITAVGWRMTFVILMAAGFVWAALWFLLFKDRPEDHNGLPDAERAHILATRQQATPLTDTAPLPLLRTPNLTLAMAQYFCSNFVFFFTLTWLFPHLKKTYDLSAVSAGWLAAAPLLAGAAGNLLSGWLVDRLYKQGKTTLSRQLPAILGFVLAAVGLVFGANANTAPLAVFWLSVAIFGADMTLAPSWALCMDIGGARAGAVSGTMNMAGNIGSFVTSLAFPYLLQWTGSPTAFFYVGAGLSLLAIGCWRAVRIPSEVSR
ncbi:MFS transporter [Armatimonas sp.]|uniref:MFS transporter n=1 Tax=Armatimonas sp. TaxID=1872638 RepID=UPI00374D8865